MTMVPPPQPAAVILNTAIGFGEGTLQDGSKCVMMRIELTLSPEGAMLLARDLMARGQAAAAQNKSGLVVANVVPKLNGDLRKP